MAVLEGVVSTALAEVGASSYSALHVQCSPLAHGALGQYRLGVRTGVLAAALAAAGEMFQFRWTDATRLCIITRLTATFQPLTAWTAATISGAPAMEAMFARAWTADGSGGTAITLTGNQNKLRTSMASSLCNSTGQRIATTAALGAGTKTLDSFPFLQTNPGKANNTNAAAATEDQSQNFPAFSYQPLRDGEHPIVLAQNEGIVIRNAIVWPAAGTGMASFEIGWAEVTAF